MFSVIVAVFRCDAGQLLGLAGTKTSFDPLHCTQDKCRCLSSCPRVDALDVLCTMHAGSAVTLTSA